MKRPEDDIVDAEFKVIGPDGRPVEHHVPRREPIIKSWVNLISLALVLTAVFFFLLWKQDRRFRQEDEQAAIRLQELSTPDTSAPALGSAPLAGSSAAPAE